MAVKMKDTAEVLAAFEAAYPGPGAGIAAWVIDWRACYPQFEDAIFEKAAELMMAENGGEPELHQGPHSAASVQEMSAEEQETARLTFIGIGDPTPEILGEWRTRHPAMADEFVAMAKDLSTDAYLRVPSLPPTGAEAGRVRARIASLVGEIEAAPRAVSVLPVREPPYLPAGDQTAGAALRERKVKVDDRHRRDIAGKREPGLGAGR